MCNSSNKTALVTGAAGFIGYHTSKKLLKEGWRVVGVDSMSHYYDVNLKYHREENLLKYRKFTSIREDVQTPGKLLEIFAKERPEIVIHLAAQAGVRHSIENPRSYLESNILGTFELLEAARSYPPVHMLMASTSSAYGDNPVMPYCETSKSDHQVSFYAATKKSSEIMAHSYSHLFDLPITMLRFFTVYGPWGRPDMALFKFTKAILNNQPIDIYNNGEMLRDFTYIDDLIYGIRHLIDILPFKLADKPHTQNKFDSLSPVAPFRVVNIGNSDPKKLMDFIHQIESSLGVEAEKRYLPMQAGDVKTTWADTKLLDSLIGPLPNTSIDIGVSLFTDWYKTYYKDNG